MTTALSITFLAGIALLAAYVVNWWRSRSWLPAELHAASLVGIEKILYAGGALPLVGRLDQVYRLPNGQHTPLEYKNRDATRLFDSDRAQLSLQAWLLRKNGRTTAPFGFVVVRERKTGRKKALKVDLGGDDYCEQLIRRHIAVKSGRESPVKARNARCKACGHRSIC